MVTERKGQTGELRICIVGSGTHFVSGISYYTYYLAQSLQRKYPTSVILMRRLVPRRWYPGRHRVGTAITDMRVASIVPTFDGIDWYVVPSLFRAAAFLRDQDPDIIIFQWWTGAVLLSVLFLLRTAIHRGAKIIVEFHEDQDSGEISLPLVERLVRPGLKYLIRNSSQFVVHSDWDKRRLCAKFGIEPVKVTVIPHGPYFLQEASGASEIQPRIKSYDGGDQVLTILFFGTIRPYKGLEDLIDAFALLPRGAGIVWRLLVVGETWEGWNLPEKKILSSPFVEEIEFVNRYVTDAEIPHVFSKADIVALPYHRSSASGPLHLAMQAGFPVVISDVGGLPEAIEAYSGGVMVRPRDPHSLAQGIVESVELCGVRHDDSHTWDETAKLYSEVIERIRK